MGRSSTPGRGRWPITIAFPATRLPRRPRSYPATSAPRNDSRGAFVASTRPHVRGNDSFGSFHASTPRLFAVTERGRFWLALFLLEIASLLVAAAFGVQAALQSFQSVTRVGPGGFG